MRRQVLSPASKHGANQPAVATDRECRLYPGDFERRCGGEPSGIVPAADQGFPRPNQTLQDQALQSGGTFWTQSQSSLTANSGTAVTINDTASTSDMWNLATVEVLAPTSALPPPVVSGVAAGGITSSGAVITWTTDQGSSSQVDYATTAAYGTSSALNSTAVTSHSVTLSGLAPVDHVSLPGG
jgi:hypothetical protein